MTRGRLCHAAAVTAPEGEVYTWGWGKDGRLGHGDETSKSVPTLVEAVSRYLKGCTAAISAGYDHTVAISVGGELLTWGGDPDKVSKLGLGLSFGSAFIRMDPSMVKMHDGFQGWRTRPLEQECTAAGAGAAGVGAAGAGVGVGAGAGAGGAGARAAREGGGALSGDATTANTTSINGWDIHSPHTGSRRLFTRH